MSVQVSVGLKGLQSFIYRVWRLRLPVYPLWRNPYVPLLVPCCYLPCLSQHESVPWMARSQEWRTAQRPLIASVQDVQIPPLADGVTDNATHYALGSPATALATPWQKASCRILAFPRHWAAILFCPCLASLLDTSRYICQFAHGMLTNWLNTSGSPSTRTRLFVFV